MRKKIAQHMISSKQTSAHVPTVFEIDFTNVDKLRRQNKDAYAERGVKLTYMPFIVQAVIAGLREFPILNASMDEQNVIYHREHQHRHRRRARLGPHRPGPQDAPTS